MGARGEEDQRRGIARAVECTGLGVDQLWGRYFAAGGNCGLIEVDAYLHGVAGLPDLDTDILAHTVNERLDEITPPVRAPYSRTLRERGPKGQGMTALVRLLEGAHLAPPERLPALVDAAADALGVRAAIYLVDYEERFLHPWRDQPSDSEPLEIETTLAGRAYRNVVTVPGRAEPKLWVPLVDGVERMGVMEVVLADASELDDPGLLTQCRWLSKLVGHLVTLLDQYGDAVHHVRLPGNRTITGELAWSLLPPLTAGVDGFVVSGVVEPRHGVSGDAFDYALSETTATLMILDAVGHDLRSGLIAATAVACHRSGRHAGKGLYEQALDIDAAIREQFGDSAFATGILAEICLSTGRLRYLNAGHPPPVIMRDGRVVKPLAGGRTRPLGLGVSEFVIGEEFLEPEDWLVLHTDGVTEARDEHGRFFGETRFADFLRREAAAGHPPPETARRLIRAILAHQDGVLQDDAAIVLARWTAPGEMSPGTLADWPA